MDSDDVFDTIRFVGFVVLVVLVFAALCKTCSVAKWKILSRVTALNIQRIAWVRLGENLLD